MVSPGMCTKRHGVLLCLSFNCIDVGHELHAILSIDIGCDIVADIACNAPLSLVSLLSLSSSILRLLLLELIDNVDELLIEWNPHKVLS